MRPVRTLFVYAALLALTVAAYLPVWHNDYIDFDDDVYITTNPEVTNGFSWSNFRWVWTNDRAPYWTPLTWLSYQLDAQCFAQPTPSGEMAIPAAAVHGQNLFWHAASVLLLFAFWRRVSGNNGASFLIAALFAVHPMHVESVAWAAERKDVLSAFFGLLALAAYARYAHKPSWWSYSTVVVVYGLSLMCKPMLMTLPCVLLLLDYWPLGRLRGDAAVPGTTKAMPWRLLLEKTPLFVLAAAIAVVTLEAREAHGSLASLESVSFSSRLATALTAYGWYLGTSFYPSHLALLYPHPYNNWSITSALLGATIVLACTLLAWQQRRQRPWLIVGWLWFLGTLFPVIGFAQGGKQAWADRFCYWPHLGLFLAVVWELVTRAERLGVPTWIRRLAALSVLGWLACLTWEQIGVWRDPFTVWQHAANVTQDNDQAHEHLARNYNVQGWAELCEAHLLEAIRIQRKRHYGSSARIPPIRPPRTTEAAQRGAINSPSAPALTAPGSAPNGTANEGGRRNARGDAGAGQQDVSPRPNGPGRS